MKMALPEEVTVNIRMELDPATTQWQRPAARLVSLEEKADDTSNSMRDMITKAVKSIMAQSGLQTSKPQVPTSNTSAAEISYRDLSQSFQRVSRSMHTISSQMEEVNKSINLAGKTFDTMIIDEWGELSVDVHEEIRRKHITETQKAFERAQEAAKQRRLEQEAIEAAAQRDLEANPNFGMF